MAATCLLGRLAGANINLLQPFAVERHVFFANGRALPLSLAGLKELSRVASSAPAYNWPPAAQTGRFGFSAQKRPKLAR